MPPQAVVQPPRSPMGTIGPEGSYGPKRGEGVVDVVERVIGTPGEYPFSRTEPMVIRAKEQLNKPTKFLNLPLYICSSALSSMDSDQACHDSF